MTFGKKIIVDTKLNNHKTTPVWDVRWQCYIYLKYKRQIGIEKISSWEVTRKLILGIESEKIRKKKCTVIKLSAKEDHWRTDLILSNFFFFFVIE